MQTKLYFIMKSKALFIKWKLHRLFGPFRNLFLNLAYMSDMSRWVANNRNPGYNDFYKSKWDYNRRYNLYQHLLESEGLANQSLQYVEFGVAQGESFRWWVAHNTNSDSKFDGFDTFSGLPEAWGPFKAGDMSTNNKVPDIKDERVKFHTGLFQQTLTGFLEQMDGNKRKVIHLDADLYSSTLYVLTSLAPYLKKDDIILFDEFSVPQHEFLAFKNFTESYYRSLQLIAAANNYFFTAFKVAQ